MGGVVMFETTRMSEDCTFKDPIELLDYKMLIGHFNLTIIGKRYSTITEDDFETEENSALIYRMTFKPSMPIEAIGDLNVLFISMIDQSEIEIPMRTWDFFQKAFVGYFYDSIKLKYSTMVRLNLGLTFNENEVMYDKCEPLYIDGSIVARTFVELREIPTYDNFETFDESDDDEYTFDDDDEETPFDDENQKG